MSSINNVSEVNSGFMKEQRKRAIARFSGRVDFIEVDGVHRYSMGGDFADFQPGMIVEPTNEDYGPRRVIMGGAKRYSPWIYGRFEDNHFGIGYVASSVGGAKSVKDIYFSLFKPMYISFSSGKVLIRRMHTFSAGVADSLPDQLFEHIQGTLERSLGKMVVPNCLARLSDDFALGKSARSALARFKARSSVNSE